MTDLKRVPSTDIERLVGARRHPTVHLGRAVSEEQTVYILHSRECLDSGIDLLDCPYSVALDEFGIDTDDDWAGYEDVVVSLHIVDDVLQPMPWQEEADDGQH